MSSVKVEYVKNGQVIDTSTFEGGVASGWEGFYTSRLALAREGISTRIVEGQQYEQSPQAQEGRMYAEGSYKQDIYQKAQGIISQGGPKTAEDRYWYERAQQQGMITETRVAVEQTPSPPLAQAIQQSQQTRSWQGQQLPMTGLEGASIKPMFLKPFSDLTPSEQIEAQRALNQPSSLENKITYNLNPFQPTKYEQTGQPQSYAKPTSIADVYGRRVEQPYPEYVAPEVEYQYPEIRNLYESINKAVYTPSDNIVFGLGQGVARGVIGFVPGTIEFGKQMASTIPKGGPVGQFASDIFTLGTGGKIEDTLFPNIWKGQAEAFVSEPAATTSEFITGIALFGGAEGLLKEGIQRGPTYRYTFKKWTTPTPEVPSILKTIEVVKPGRETLFGYEIKTTPEIVKDIGKVDADASLFAGKGSSFVIEAGEKGPTSLSLKLREIGGAAKTSGEKTTFAGKGNIFDISLLDEGKITGEMVSLKGSLTKVFEGGEKTIFKGKLFEKSPTYEATSKLNIDRTKMGSAPLLEGGTIFEPPKPVGTTSLFRDLYRQTRVERKLPATEYRESLFSTTRGGLESTLEITKYKNKFRTTTSSSLPFRKGIDTFTTDEGLFNLKDLKKTTPTVKVPVETDMGSGLKSIVFQEKKLLLPEQPPTQALVKPFFREGLVSKRIVETPGVFKQIRVPVEPEFKPMKAFTEYVEKIKTPPTKFRFIPPVTNTNLRYSQAQRTALFTGTKTKTSLFSQQATKPIQSIVPKTSTLLGGSQITPTKREITYQYQPQLREKTIEKYIYKEPTITNFYKINPVLPREKIIKPFYGQETRKYKEKKDISATFIKKAEKYTANVAGLYLGAKKGKKGKLYSGFEARG